ncbi:MAG TPA: sterol desaturase family protein [Bacteriovoracaceae bacterium]|nr:sterol desaturase family protein [Bacteriovoracaceae bacterium]
MALAGVGALSLRFVFFPLVFLVSQWGETKQIGLSHYWGFTGPISFFLIILFLDYSLYFWHWLNHKVRFLWRFHNVHHVDLDMDVSTASRFHFGELIISSLFRSVQVLVFGVAPETLIVYEVLTTLSTQFHHSNISLPMGFEKQLNKIFVTPRMHGIHHSIVREETDSNYSTIFCFWDRLHASLKINVPQEEITIGVASYRDQKEITFLKSLLLPFKKQRAWKLPDGTVLVI